MNQNSPSSSSTLVRALGLRDSLAIVIGSMIGTGIFLKTAVMTQMVGNSFWVTMAWLAAGLLSLLGAMTYAELGALFPQAGGGYVFIREAYGRLPAFLAGWVSFWIVLPGSVAAYAVGSAVFIGSAFGTQEWNLHLALGLITFFAAINCLAVSFGGLVQSILTALKVALILGLIIAIFLFAPNPQAIALTNLSTSSLTWGAFGIATLSALWAFDGWEAIARVAGEIKNPQKVIPWSLVAGILIVFGLYATLNLAFFYALPLSEIVTSNSSAHPDALPVATKSVVGFLGTSGIQLLSIVFLISAVGAMNGCILTSARVPFAMAKDGLFFSYLNKVSPRTRVPVRAIWTQALVAGALAASGSFDQLTNYVVFSAWIFYGITGLSLFVFRKRLKEATRSFRVPLYPLVPGIFVLMSGALVITTLIESPRESLIGLGFIALGVPFYFAFFRKGESAPAPRNS